jgi:hypothetical protein
MKVTHNFTVVSKCPVNDGVDVYDAIARTERLIKVETILTEVEHYKDVAAYQEDICESLSQELGCEVTLIGTHSGVRTEVTCGTA